MRPVTILAIESSCDETSAAICVDGKILSNHIANQTVHEKYGGVVPELASRAHMQNIVPVVHSALQTAFPGAPDLTSIDAVAFTQAPGLIGSLLVGTQFAKSLALSLNKPLIGVHHMQAHVLANLIDENRPSFPFLCLTVSGGHTQIVLAKSPLELEVIGETIDDAAGEAFDKTAKLLGLPYPGGPLIDKYAKLGDPLRFKFAEPQIPELDFSFSGLKTSVLYFLQKQEPGFIEQNLHDLCASVQHTIINILLKKVKKAVQETGVKQVCIAGGVSANSGLRTALQELGVKHKWQTFIPKFEYCTDNAAMIAITAYYKYQASQFTGLEASPSARAEW
ncbi:O-sialoglycoprotein endopeptidase [Hydrobacter penzbergensis]|jgi:N6-L-threonylcarbamoyladenine synthase|uniref:tRNA N6-adenosine threonylcarbamoyltransferase n=1 Tax=Hydrobacter penzbergensis TaxID=1235997 RepID=A0A8X8IG28_9BACT|nr:tRNA (adenosine(37)-N6)-threonylcarbamoyltransferase complex transferase subunit TsaD [Hydrobacter penzbergensis]MBN8719597.1 tRNA (adenosine(37)-N6)-threonylcarbamoyltransferase complex transferase subunit TsaD [Sediminibacterium magnilacihabitans]PQV60393.1 O-sialoglycoprotein endopeptidase [Sediminibacterium magnilacihabitans]SDX06264.1 O-sialoglycoprotein endopeptidase [Hydrobacter penzbergensis]